jgi:hypothetical protein
VGSENPGRSVDDRNRCGARPKITEREACSLVCCKLLDAMLAIAVQEGVPKDRMAMTAEPS